jgi:hypothetical protein
VLVTRTPFHLLTGEAANLKRVLDDFSVLRQRCAKTGSIEHANLFILVG